MSTEPGPGGRSATFLVGLLLIVALAFTYAGLRHNGFVTWDDPNYITGNAHVRAGITFAGVEWAFRSREFANWHPLTWLSHMLDCQLFGLAPAYHHLTNLLFHGANTLLLLVLLIRLTGSLPRSAIVAALFALHPLHVESVAWASERKDMLSTFFGLWALFFYAGYARQPSVGRYVPVALSFVLSLLCKGMMVTLPFVLLLLDAWPLQRLTFRRQVLVRLLLEKLPLLLLSILSCVMTVVAQGQAVVPMERLPFPSRLANALLGYSFYLWKAVWPARLAFLYPRPDRWPLWALFGAVAVLVCGSALALLWWRRRPAIAVGWLWYLGTAVPVIGLVQVGMQFAADRYTYVPLIGIFIALAWAVPESWLNRGPFAGALCVLLFSLGLLSHRQVSTWRDSFVLYQHALDVTENNAMAHFFLADALSDAGRTKEAAFHYNEHFRLKLSQEQPHMEQLVEAAKKGSFEQALSGFIEKLGRRPRDNVIHLALRDYLKQSGQPDKDLSRALCRVAGVLDAKGALAEAIGYYREAVRLDPTYPRAQHDLGSALASFGELGTAIVHLSQALRLRPESQQARDSLALALQAYDGGPSSSPYPQALREVPDLAAAHVLLADALRRAGRSQEAARHYQQALRIAPGNQDAARGLGAVTDGPANSP
jgi:tetratricopeptide (TPR) repeat protein